MRQLYGNKSFLHGGIFHEEVYMTPPQGFIPSTLIMFANSLCYGLKQAPRARFTRFSLRTFFLHIELPSDRRLVFSFPFLLPAIQF